MMVYLLLEDFWHEGQRVAGVFSTLEKAMAEADRMQAANASVADRLLVDELEVDPPSCGGVARGEVWSSWDTETKAPPQ